MIICKVCQELFKNTISWKHLKKHDMTVSQYKELHGSVVSEEYRELKRSQTAGEHNPNYGKTHTWSLEQKQAIKGRTPHNKGLPMSEEQKEKLREKALDRNKEWRENGVSQCVGRTVSNETKTKIRESRKKQIITSDQAIRATETRKQNGHPMVSFKGKHHTDETKKRLSEISTIRNIEKSNESHDRILQLIEEYNLTLISSLESGYSYVQLKCNECQHEFSYTKQYFTNSKTFSDMCPICFPRNMTKSYEQLEIFEFIKQYCPDAIYNYRTHYHSKEIDIFIPSLNLGFEYNGLYWHSEIYKNKTYHIDKTNNAIKQNVRLIHIFSDEWINNPDIVKSRIKHLLKINYKKIYARKCEIREIGKEAIYFLKKHHLQGVGRSTIKLGLYYNNQLVSVMTFLNSDISKKIDGWELNRFCNIDETVVVGGANKLFNYFVKKYNPSTIISFADARWSGVDAVYLKLGFTYKYLSSPNYWYIIKPYNKRYHRFGLRKPENTILSEYELRTNEGYIRIWDCGSHKFIWENKKGG